MVHFLGAPGSLTRAPRTKPTKKARSQRPIHIGLENTKTTNAIQRRIGSETLAISKNPAMEGGGRTSRHHTISAHHPNNRRTQDTIHVCRSVFLVSIFNQADIFANSEGG